MVEVGTFHAKTHLTQLLERVSKGERVVITRRGKPIAMLVPPETVTATDVTAVVRDMLSHRDQHGPKLGRGLSIRKLVEEGRRF
jgi:prevent-host-death family protein